MDIRRYLSLLKRHRLILIEAVVVIAFFAWLLASLRTPVYRATARVLLLPDDPAEQLTPTNNPQNAQNPDRNVVAQIQIMKSLGVAQQAAKAIPGSNPGALLSSVSVAQSGASDVLTVSATNIDQTRAQDTANAFATGYVENRRLAQVSGLQSASNDINTQLQQIQNQIAQLDDQISKTPSSGGSTAPIPPAQPATTPNTQPTAPPVAPDITPGGQPTTVEGLMSARYAAAIQYQTLYARQQELLVDINLKHGDAEVVSTAGTPSAPISPKPLRDGILGAIVGLLVGLGIALLRDQLDDRMHSSAEVERVTHLPVVGRLPYDDKVAKEDDVLVAAERPTGVLAEAARSLRTVIDFLGVDEPVRSLVVTSPGPGDGKSFVTANLAIVYAQAGYRTVIVSADLRRPRLDDLLLGGRQPEGLSTLIAPPARAGAARAAARLAAAQEGAEANASVSSPGRRPRPKGRPFESVLHTTAVDKLFILPAGPTPPNPAELLGSKRFLEILETLTDWADIVLVDTPPLVPVTDAAVVAPSVDGVLLVVANDETHRDAATRAHAILESSHARVLGAVVNKEHAVSGGYYYMAYYGEDPEARRSRLARLFGRGKRHRRGLPSDLGHDETATGDWQASPEQVPVAARLAARDANGSNGNGNAAHPPPGPGQTSADAGEQIPRRPPPPPPPPPPGRASGTESARSLASAAWSSLTGQSRGRRSRR